MATEQLRVQVSADVAGAVNGINQVNGALSRTSQQTQRTGRDFTGLSRVIQDLPFGFVAISNNLTQLLPAAGAAGLAFSVLVAAITFASTGLSNWTRGLTGSKDGIEANSASLIRLSSDIDDAKDRMDQFVSVLDQINKIGKLRLDIDFGKGLGTDLLNLQGISVGNRELIAQLEDTEKIVNDGLSKIRAAFGSKIADTKFFDAYTQGVLDASELPEDLKKLFDQMTDVEKDHLKIQGDILKARNGQNIIYAQIEQQKVDIIEEGNKKAKEARDKAAKERQRQLAEEQKELEEHMKRMKEILITSSSTDFNVGTFFKVELAKFDAQQNPSETDSAKLMRKQLEAKGPIPLKVIVAPEVALSKPPDLTDIQIALQEAVSKMAVEAFSTIGDAIAAGITGGNIGDAFVSLFTFIGTALQDFGKQVIALSSIMIALKKAIGAFNPAASLAAGVGLVIVGGILKNLKPKGFAQGGLAFGPTLGLVGEGIGTNRSNPEVIAPLDKLKHFIGGNNGTQVFIPSLELSYNKLMVAFNRAGKYGGLTS